MEERERGSGKKEVERKRGEKNECKTTLVISEVPGV